MWDPRETRRKCRSIRDRWVGMERRPIGLFQRLVRDLASPGGVILDIGCGRRAVILRMLAAGFRAGYGIDLEIPALAREGNVTLLPGDAADIPLGDESVDVIISTNLVEHLEDPLAMLRECRRLLRPGGHAVILAPNTFYPPLAIGRALPHWLRVWLNRLLTGTGEQDTFPALYRANSAGALGEMARAAGLTSVSIEYVVDHPHYLMFSVLAYRAGILIERLLLRPRRLAFLRHSLVCHLQKAVVPVAARQAQTLSSLAESPAA